MESSMIRVMALCAAGMTAGSASAALFGPDSFGYIGDDDPGISRLNVLGQNPVLTNNDNDAVLLPLGFAFNFYGTAYTDIWVSNNGIASFGAPNNDPINVDLTTTAPTVNVPTIAVLWDDWQTTSSSLDAVFHDTIGPTGDQKFVVEWFVSRPVPLSSGNVTFQLVLHEADGTIDFFYSDSTTGGAGSNGASATIAIRDLDGELFGRVLQYSFNSPVLANIDDSVRFIIPEPGMFALAAAGAGLMMSRRRR